jgi:hypothetical protein
MGGASQVSQDQVAAPIPMLITVRALTGVPPRAVRALRASGHLPQHGVHFGHHVDAVDDERALGHPQRHVQRAGPR